MRYPPSPEQLARYRETHRKRREARARALAARRERAWAEARKAARLLKEEFGATRVVLFGSLAREGGRFFDERSDIDLAVWGIAPRRFFVAWAAVEALGETPFDLVDGALASPTLRAVIESEGVEL
nr:nucleotidyltransferase domain-containing protein [Ardenticatena sp.]